MQRYSAGSHSLGTNGRKTEGGGVLYATLGTAEQADTDGLKFTVEERPQS